MSTEQHFSIHDILHFRIIDRRSYLAKHLISVSSEYRNFSTHHPKKPDLIIELGSFSPDVSGCTVLDNDFYVKKGYIYAKDRYRQAKWKYEIAGIDEDPMVVRIDPNILGGMFISAFLLDYLICYKLNEKGIPILHGSCVEKNDKAYIFSGQGGCGKTTTALSFVEKGYRFLADNFIIVSDGKAISFPSPLNLFSFNFHPMLKSRMNKGKVMEVYLKHILYILSLRYARFVTKVNPAKIFPKSIIQSGEISKILLLLPKESFTAQVISHEEFLKHALYNLRLDMVSFDKILNLYSFVYPESSFAEHWVRYESNLKNSLTNITSYKIELPKKYEKDTFNNIYQLTRK